MSEGDQNRLVDLIVKWDELRDRGETVSPEELCPDDMELQAALRERIAQRLQIEQLIATPSSSGTESSVRNLSSSKSPAHGGKREESNAPGPERIGRYRVERLLGAGGFGQVFLAYDDELSRYVAIKIPHRELCSYHKYVDTYRREARFVAGLDHPNIVPVYDVGSSDRYPCFIVSKYIAGTNLFVQMSQSRQAFGETATIVATIAEALHYTHALGLIHRDIKPANILISTTGQPFLVDFGLALNERDAIDGRRFAGTPSYMSPEQARGEAHRVDGRSDIFSLGVVLYELLTRQKPLKGETDSEILAQIVSVEPQPPCHIDESIPSELERICLKALSKRAGDRYQTAHDFAEDLRYFLRGLHQSSAGASETVRFDRDHTRHPPTISNTNSTSDAVESVQVVPKGLRSFDAHDADFFLELLPGPRDRNGLPESIRFWKTRIEEEDAGRAFSVGLIYGPSGCGKSSLVKAGLLPRLASRISVVYLEATPDETETKLLSGLRKHCPGVLEAGDLPQTIAELRRGNGLPAGGKVLIILDQFEQWLHAHKEMQNAELVQALRHCDGSRVQCVLMVRDDFWLGVSRFIKELEVHLVEGDNSSLVDLFDIDHAKKVLASFGRAFGKIPDNAADISREQQEFLNLATIGLAQEGKVISVRLSLLADMMKSKAWIPGALKAMGGTEGVGETFLEETFGDATVPVERREHQKAIIKVLTALLPDFGTEIKGHRRSYEELLQASGYVGRLKDFDELLRILDRDIRLITPTDLLDGDNDREPWSTQVDHKYYQLTHDYLVPSLRNWLTRKQKETRRGRAQLLLSDWSSIWSNKPENRNLPGLFDWFRIRVSSQPRFWTEPQQKMMRAAGRYHSLRSMTLGLILIIATLTGLTIRSQVIEQERADHAGGLVGEVINAEIGRVPEIIDLMAASRKWVDPLLREAMGNTALSPSQKLNASPALLRVDPRPLEAIYNRLLQATPDEVPVIRAELMPYRDQLAPRLWTVVESSAKSQPAQRLRAAAALAAFDPDGAGWTQLSPSLAEQLVNENQFFSKIWSECFRPIKSQLTAPLASIYRDRHRSPSERSVATNFLSEYAEDEPELLANLLMDSDEEQFGVIYPEFKEQSDRGLPFLEREIERSLEDTIGDEKEQLARRQANAAVVLLGLNRSEKVWPMLRHSTDPRARSYLIHRFFPLGADPAQLLARLKIESDITIRRALILSLGEFDEQILPLETRAAWIPPLRLIYRNDADSGLHAAADWLLRRWHDEAWLKQTVEEWANDQRLRESRIEAIRHALSGSQPGNSHDWYVNSLGQTFVVCPGPLEFMMGSDEIDPGPISKERRHRRRIGRSYAITTTPVTLEQYRKFEADYGNGFAADWLRAPDLPVIGISWYMGALFCNWLSEREGIPAEQHCFSVRGQILKLKKNYLALHGYRFPTEAEMEYATRSGAVTSRYFGETDELLPHYAWYQPNSQEKFWPVGTKKPNDFGLFDTHGNVFTWCQGSYQLYPEGELIEDEDHEVLVPTTTPRALRGGSFIDRSPLVRSPFRNADQPTARNHSFGFRLVRTIEPVSAKTSAPDTPAAEVNQQ